MARCTPKCQTPISGVGLDSRRKDRIDGIDSIEARVRDIYLNNPRQRVGGHPPRIIKGGPRVSPVN
jgi:hypothetical protein